jgi:peptide/nickel transport system substrate-binding protein
MAIKNQIEAIGNVTVNLNPVETPAYWDDLMAGQFQMAMVGWYPDYWDPDDYMATFYDPAGTPTIGSFYNNSVQHNLTVQEEFTINMSKRVQIFQEAQNISAQDIAFIPLYENNLMVYSLKTVSGIEFDPMLTFQLWVLQKTG